MNVAVLMIISIGILAVAYRVYGKFLARHLGVDSSRPTPANTVNDGVDYIPTKPLILFGHHFASIAAAGPIIGPTLAIFYGYLPSWLWIILGVTFIGAVHDFTALFVSVRQGGKSVAEVARNTLGTAGFVFYVLFSILLCLLVGAAFLGIAADALTSHYLLADLNLISEQTIFRTIDFKGETHALTGGIATTSVIVMTLAAPFLGWLLYRRQISVKVASLLAVVICCVSFAIGFLFPVTLDPTSHTTAQVVLVMLCLYCFVASWIPIWVVLQPRDFINVHVLYVGMAAMVIGLIGCGLNGVTVSGPAWNFNAESFRALGMAWPFLFVTIACGACSGAHGLICGGTTCKQLNSEKHAPAIGYGAMLLEALLGICVLLMIIGPLGFDQYRDIVWPSDGKGSAVRGFALSVGITLEKGIGLSREHGTIFGIILLEGFVLTTTDTVLRLVRYLFEELWSVIWKVPPAFLRFKFVNAALAITLTAVLAFTNGYTAIWPVFGSANQLLAALTLIAATVWLVHRSRKAWYVAIPAVFMAITTVVSLLQLLPRFIANPDISQKIPLLTANIVLLLLSAGVVLLALSQLSKYWKQQKKYSASELV